jgi:2-C-methyl-D-erythritol 4-phosphate cytidylyltransferase/2-C-methyl-D-erythritol 2,4-cyclodiphosphate synthase
VHRVGQGIDVHAFTEDRPLVLGGVRIADSGGLAGHSDADAILHALTDALLGAIGAGDIGEHFPSSEDRWKDAPSRLFVDEAVRLINERGGTISSVDLTVIAQHPRLSPHKEAIRESVAGILGVPSGRVNVKATTTDGLGFTGRGEGLCAMATVCIDLGGAAV